MKLPHGTPLVVIDAQKGFDTVQLPRNNPACEANIAVLLAAWRKAGWPVIHVRHHSQSPTGWFYPGTPGTAAKPEAVELPGEPVLVKRVHSAFVDTELDATLKKVQAKAIVFCGIQTNYCVATTARVASNIGYRTYVAGDACMTFDVQMLDGSRTPAQLVHDLALAELAEEFGTVATTAVLCRGVTQRSG